MRYSISILSVSALVIASSFAQAGGISDEVMEAPIAIVQPEPEPAGSSINSTYLIVGVLAALLITAAVNANNDDDDESTPMASDMRLKQDVTRIGTTDSGLALYSFRYIEQDQLYSGVMAQDVLMHTPKAVVMQPNGYLAVKYGMLGIAMETLD